MACSNIAMIKDSSGSGEESFDRSSCVLHSFLEGDNKFGKNSVTEYSWLGKGSSVGEQSIVSNVFVPNGLSLPNNAFLHTVCVEAEDGTGHRYVTISFGIKDNVKKTCADVSSAGELKWHSTSLDKALKLLAYPQVLLATSEILLNCTKGRNVIYHIEKPFFHPTLLRLLKHQITTEKLMEMNNQFRINMRKAIVHMSGFFDQSDLTLFALKAPS